MWVGGWGEVGGENMETVISMRELKGFYVICVIFGTSTYVLILACHGREETPDLYVVICSTQF